MLKRTVEKPNGMRNYVKTGRSSPRPSFTAVDRFKLRNSGLVVTVELDRDTDDFSYLIGKKIIVDGKIEICFSVERLPHAAPWKKGERVGLLIRKEA